MLQHSLQLYYFSCFLVHSQHIVIIIVYNIYRRRLHKLVKLVSDPLCIIDKIKQIIKLNYKNIIYNI